MATSRSRVVGTFDGLSDCLWRSTVSPLTRAKAWFVALTDHLGMTVTQQGGVAHQSGALRTHKGRRTCPITSGVPELRRGLSSTNQYCEISGVLRLTRTLHRS